MPQSWLWYQGLMQGFSKGDRKGVGEKEGAFLLAPRALSPGKEEGLVGFHSLLPQPILLREGP